MEPSLCLDGELQGITPSQGGRHACWRAQGELQNQPDSDCPPPPDPIRLRQSLRHCVSQGQIGASRFVQFSDSAAAGEAVTPRRAAAAAAADAGVLLLSLIEDSDEDADGAAAAAAVTAEAAEERRGSAVLRPSPPCTLLRAMSQGQGSAVLRRSRGFRREETGEAADPQPPRAHAAARMAPLTAPPSEAFVLLGHHRAKSTSSADVVLHAQPPPVAAFGATSGGGRQLFRPAKYERPAACSAFALSGLPSARGEGDDHDGRGGDGDAQATYCGGVSASPRRRRSSAMRGDESYYCGGSRPSPSPSPSDSSSSSSSNDDDDGVDGPPLLLRPVRATRPVHGGDDGGGQSIAAARTSQRTSPSACGETGVHLLVSDSSASGSSIDVDSLLTPRGSDTMAYKHQYQQRPPQPPPPPQQQQHYHVVMTSSGTVVPAAVQAAHNSADGGGGGQMLRAPAAAAAAAAGARRRSEHGNKRRGRRQHERRRTSCWTVDDDGAGAESDGSSSTDTANAAATDNDSAEDDEGLIRVLHPAAAAAAVGRDVAGVGRVLRPPAAAAAAAAAATGAGAGAATLGSRQSVGGSSTLYTLGGMAMLSSAPICSPAPLIMRSGGGRFTNDFASSSPAAAAAALYGSALSQDLPWTPPRPPSSAAATAEDGKTTSGSLSIPMLPARRLLRPLSLARDSELQQPTSSTGFGGGGAGGGGGGGGREAPPRRAWGTGSVSAGNSQRTSLEIATADTAAARREALRGWSSRNLLVPHQHQQQQQSDGGGGSWRRTGVNWVGLEDEAAPPPPSSPFVHTASSSPRAPKPVTAMPAEGDCYRWGRRPMSSAADSEGSGSGGEDGGDAGDREEGVGAAAATGAGAGRQRAPGGGLRLPRLHRLLQPAAAASFSRLQDNAATFWQTRVAKSSSALKVP
ncbi:hypothetical protein PLESTB_000220700 [Pleodorina starrii]|uniref:Uncharacterized protein n=1 Tax=Pleodorina starrii TaxID=330485 RepID=A0A9W6EY77_9CHLO|nr:hypothetical protein PLESTM_001546400 [Pleodorina starrii]GLC49452.1 hypothetical protein PLESTB_000220700 [Pleodorina starrii]GLC75685.1 hypothetical protein PLESTF_001673700 [Pleodorina starrii]